MLKFIMGIIVSAVGLVLAVCVITLAGVVIIPLVLFGAAIVFVMKATLLI